MATSAEIKAAIDQIKSRMAMIDSEIADLEKAEEPQSEYLLRLSKEVGKRDPAKGVEIADLAYRAKYSESQSVRANNKEAQQMLKGVAGDFRVISPTDQSSWTATRNKWIAMYPTLAGVIPEQASQAAWESLQAGYGAAEEVAPKSDWAKKMDTVKQVGAISGIAAGLKETDPTQSSALATTGLGLLQGAGLADPTTGPGVDALRKQYAADIDNLVAKVTADEDLPDTKDLFAKLEKDGITGAALKSMKDSIVNDLTRRKKSLIDQRDWSDDMQKSMATAYNDAVKATPAARAKINAVFRMAREGRDMGALANAAKEVQGDVLADNEFTRYMDKSLLDQFENIIKGKLGLAPEASKESVLTLLNVLIDNFNTSVKSMEKANEKITNNKYVLNKVDLTPIPPMTLSDITYKGNNAGGGNKTGFGGREMTKATAMNMARSRGLNELSVDKSPNGKWYAVDKDDKVVYLE